MLRLPLLAICVLAAVGSANAWTCVPTCDWVETFSKQDTPGQQDSNFWGAGIISEFPGLRVQDVSGSPEAHASVWPVLGDSSPEGRWAYTGTVSGITGRGLWSVWFITEHYGFCAGGGTHAGDTWMGARLAEPGEWAAGECLGPPSSEYFPYDVPRQFEIVLDETNGHWTGSIGYYATTGARVTLLPFDLGTDHPGSWEYIHVYIFDGSPVVTLDDFMFDAPSLV